jgi:hypothetical protein
MLIIVSNDLIYVINSPVARNCWIKERIFRQVLGFVQLIQEAIRVFQVEQYHHQLHQSAQTLFLLFYRKICTTGKSELPFLFTNIT